MTPYQLKTLMEWMDLRFPILLAFYSNPNDEPRRKALARELEELDSNYIDLLSQIDSP